MSDNIIRYRAIRNALDKMYPSQPKGNFARHLNTLAAMINGIVGSRHTHLPKIAEMNPCKAKIASVEKRIKRWLMNENITHELIFLPFAAALLTMLGLKEIVLAMDGSTVGRGCMTLIVNVIYKKRALPLAYIVVKKKKGHFLEQMHIDLLNSVKTIIPENTQRVVFLGDGEFDGVELQKTLKKLGWLYVCRTAKSIKIYLDDEEFEIGILSTLVPPGYSRCKRHVLFTGKKYGPVNVIVWHDEDHEEPIYLVTNVKSVKKACNYYSKRFRIETFFSDQKSRGFNIHKSHLSAPERISRLMMGACLAYIWMIFLGTLAMAHGWNKIVHRTDRCDLSLFQLGLRFLRYLLNQAIKIPVAFHPYSVCDNNNPLIQDVIKSVR